MRGRHCSPQEGTPPYGFRFSQYSRSFLRNSPWRGERRVGKERISRRSPLPGLGPNPFQPLGELVPQLAEGLQTVLEGLGGGLPGL